MGSNKIENLASADSTDDAMPKTDIQSTFVDEAGDTMSGDLKLGGYDIKNVDSLDNGTARTLTLGSGGNVNIPNGNLDVKGNDIVLDQDSDPQIGIAQNLELAKQQWDGSDRVNFHAEGSSLSGGTLYLTQHDSSAGSSQDIARFNTGGNVEIPNGNLNLSKNNLEFVGGLVSKNGVSCSASQALLGDGTCGKAGGGGTLSETLAKGSEANTSIEVSGSSQVANITMDGSKTLAFSGSSNVEIPNGNLKMDTGNLQFRQSEFSVQTHSQSVLYYKNSSQTGIQTPFGSGTVAKFYDTANDQDILEAHEGGNVKIPNGNLNMNSNNITNVGSSDVDMQYDASQSRMEITSNGNTDICIGNC